ncbi:MAG: HEAT repeat domain-containing protein [Nitrososphaeraceae archaeon]
MELIFDEYQVRRLPPRERLDKIKQILRSEKDESIRWDGVWLAGEITDGMDTEDPMFAEVADLLAWVLANDVNGIVKHEASFQIAARNMRKKIPNLIHSAIYDGSEITRHESIEALGLIRAHESRETLEMLARNQSETDGVRETATFVLKRLDRVKGDYKVETIV